MSTKGRPINRPAASQFGQKKQTTSPFVPPSQSPFIPPQQVKQDPSEQLEDAEIALPKEVTEDPKESKSSGGFSKTAAIAICLLLIVVGVIGLVIFLFIHNRKSDEEDEDEKKKKEEEEKKQKQKIVDDFNKLNIELQELRKANAQLSYNLKEVTAENARLEQAANPENVIQNFKINNNLPTENDYTDIPDKPKDPSEKTEAEKTKKEKREEVMAMVNRPRQTVADMQQKEADLKEAMRKKSEEDSRDMLDGETNAKIFTVHEDEVDDEVLIGSMNSGGSLKE